MLGLKLIHVSKSGHWYLYVTIIVIVGVFVHREINHEVN